MTACASAYSVGRGKPPLHTQFKKGQSGNPSGKPGPAKLARDRFQRALYAALEGREAEVEASKPDNILAGIARRMALDAAAGRAPAVRMVLSLLDAESRKESAEADPAQARAAEEEASLLQGKTQGKETVWLEDILWPGESDFGSRPCGSEPAASPSTRNGAPPSSLLQGKKQGSGKIPGGHVSAIPQSNRMAAATPAQPGRHASLLMGSARISHPASSGTIRVGGKIVDG